MLLNGVFDLVAKAPLVNMKQFNGEYGCLTCTHPGTLVTRGVRVYLPNAHPPPEARTHETTMQAATEAKSTGVSSVRGIKGVSFPAPILNLANSIPVDYMHAVLEGVTKWLLHAWFDSENHSEAYYIGRSIRQADSLLLSQRPPSELSRPPRSIQKHLSYWKASELSNWLLYYSLPVLMDILPAMFIHHYALLVCALHILLQDSLTPSQIEAAEEMLCDFVLLLPELYGERSCTANAHSLTHLTKYVRLWGPLWTHSAFGFESKNGTLKHLFHSRSNIVDQLIFNVDVQQTLQLLDPTLQQESPEFLEFYMTMTGSAPRRGMRRITNGMYIVGGLQKKQVSYSLRSLLGTIPSETQAFSRAFVKGSLYHSTQYGKGQGKRNNQICQFSSEEGFKFGQIQLFALIPDPVAIIEVFEPSDSTFLKRVGHPCRRILNDYKNIDFLGAYMHEIKPSQTNTQLEVVPMQHIMGKAVDLHSATQVLL